MRVVVGRAGALVHGHGHKHVLLEGQDGGHLGVGSSRREGRRAWQRGGHGAGWKGARGERGVQGQREGWPGERGMGPGGGGGARAKGGEGLNHTACTPGGAGRAHPGVNGSEPLNPSSLATSENEAAVKPSAGWQEDSRPPRPAPRPPTLTHTSCASQSHARNVLPNYMRAMCGPGWRV